MFNNMRIVANIDVVGLFLCPTTSEDLCPLLSIFSGKLMETKFLQSLKASSPMFSTFSGRLIEVRSVHPLKAPLPMVVTAEGMVIEAKDEQSAKAQSPMLVTLVGMVIEVKEEQPVKVSSLMVVTLVGIVMDVKEEQFSKASLAILVTVYVLASYSTLAGSDTSPDTPTLPIISHVLSSADCTLYLMSPTVKSCAETCKHAIRHRKDSKIFFFILH